VNGRASGKKEKFKRESPRKKSCQTWGKEEQRGNAAKGLSERTEGLKENQRNTLSRGRRKWGIDAEAVEGLGKKKRAKERKA